MCRCSGDKHVNKTCGAGGGDGRAHPHSRLHTPQTQHSRPGAAARTLAPRQTARLWPLPPGPVGVGGQQVGMLTGTSVFRFQRKIRASRERMRTWEPDPSKKKGKGGSGLTLPASSCRTGGHFPEPLPGHVHARNAMWTNLTNTSPGRSPHGAGERVAGMPAPVDQEGG